MKSCVTFFSVAFRSDSGLWPPIADGSSRSHSLDAPYSVGLLWTSDQPVAEISAWQHTQHSQETNVHVPHGFRTHKSSKRAAADPLLNRAATLMSHKSIYGLFSCVLIAINISWLRLLLIVDGPRLTNCVSYWLWNLFLCFIFMNMLGWYGSWSLPISRTTRLAEIFLSPGYNQQWLQSWATIYDVNWRCVYNRDVHHWKHI
jgi:hypothetical protein